MMKKTILLMLTYILFSCNENNNIDFQVSGEWKLVQMSGNIPNSETTGTDMEYQERYIFNTNGTFEKTRDTKGLIETASGVYITKNSSNENLIELTFTNESILAGSCISNIKEIMVLKSKSTFSSTWLACDGPGLDYEKIK